MTQYRRDPYYVTRVRHSTALRRWQPLIQSAVMVAALFSAIALGYGL